MHPIFCKFFSVRGFALSNLVFMMRKYQILSAGMNINLFSEVFFRHLRAFNMPSRTALTPRRFPGRFSLLFRFPKHKIKRIFFFVFSCNEKRSSSRPQIIQILMRKLSVTFKLSCTVINRSVFFIGVSFFNQCGNHFHHAADFFCCKRIFRGRFYIHCFHVFFTFRNISFRYLISRNAFFNRFFNNFIIYVCKV